MTMDYGTDELSTPVDGSQVNFRSEALVVGYTDIVECEKEVISSKSFLTVVISVLNSNYFAITKSWFSDDLR